LTPQDPQAIHTKGTMVLIFMVQLQTKTKQIKPTIQSTRIPSAIHPVLVVQFKCLIQWNKLRNFKLVLLVRVTKRAKVEKGGGRGDGCKTKRELPRDIRFKCHCRYSHVFHKPGHKLEISPRFGLLLRHVSCPAQHLYHRYIAPTRLICTRTSCPGKSSSLLIQVFFIFEIVPTIA